MYIKQKQLGSLKKLLSPQKVIVLYGPRRVGKTTLLNQFLKSTKENYLLVNGGDRAVHEYLSSRTLSRIKEFVGTDKLLIIDEAQKIPFIGESLKLIVDHIPGIKVIATGSSSFDLAQTIGEPLTGRKFTLLLYPLAQIELKQYEKVHETKSKLASRLIYGSYPEVVTSVGREDKQRYLQEIINNYLYKDILELDGIRYASKISQLLELVAFQIGKEVSLSELGTGLGMSKNTVERYLDLLEKSFVIYKMRGFSRNLRKEITKMSRYYFYDNGIRNAIISNFNGLKKRDDVGMLFENYIVGERKKKREYLNIFANEYFWRTWDKKEIDLIEERGGKLYGYEFKWGSKKKPKAPADWLETYKEASYEVITPENYLEFIT